MNEKVLSIISARISSLLESEERVIIAIDGRCASGKSTLTSQLADYFDCNIIHTDDFVLQSHQRNEHTLCSIGGNIDIDRLLSETFIPMLRGEEYIYRRFDCRRMQLEPPKTLNPRRVTIVEGAYSCHPELVEFYDLTIFLTIDEDTQMKRIIRRNGEVKAKVFRDKWIPLEEGYFTRFDIRKKCDLYFNMSEES